MHAWVILFHGVNLECIRSYFKAHFTSARIFSICADPNRFKLAQHKPYALELLRIWNLLVNIYNCLKGDSASGYNALNALHLLQNNILINWASVNYVYFLADNFCSLDPVLLRQVDGIFFISFLNVLSLKREQTTERA